ncbi:MAG: sugar ABC transporter ATP-binding protein [Spirochaetaceae bacterium]|nr:sugar ABC transporter ATP-binding protein [Spirochaetaceae bacterium]
MSDANPILSVKGITKRFPGVLALDKVYFSLAKGEVHALVGENGAGKSTLMKVLLGIYRQDEGEMILKGERYSPGSPADALKCGVSMIHQEISLVPEMTISENIWIGRGKQFSRHGFIDFGLMRDKTIEILEMMKVTLDPDAEVAHLSIAAMQLVEIARAISYNSDIIIMDEPTSALTSDEVEALYAIIRDMTLKGKSIVFISHKLDEVYRICDRVTVLRDGTFVSTDPISELTRGELINRMVGRELKVMYPKADVKIGEPVLEVKGLTRKGFFENVSFTVHKGELLGFSGLMGAGRTEIMQSIFGIDPFDAGQVFLKGKELKIGNTRDAIGNKIAMVTEDRLRRGIIANLPVKYNITLAFLKGIAKMGFLSKRKENESSKRMIERLKIKAPSAESEVSLLSGGNQQKVILGKWLLNDPQVFILDEPTRGIDVGAKSEIYRLIGEMAAQGKAIIIVSSELPEIIGVCDRILVVRGGRIVGEHARKDFSQEAIMKDAFGTK